MWLILLLLVAAGGVGVLCTYNARVTGDPLRLPYLEYEAQNPMTSHFSFLPLPPQRLALPPLWPQPPPPPPRPLVPLILLAARVVSRALPKPPPPVPAAPTVPGAVPLRTPPPPPPP